MESPRFLSVVSIWIQKPHVVHPKIFAAQLPDLPVMSLVARKIVPSKRTHTNPFTENIRWSSTECTFSSEHGLYSIKIQGDQIVVDVANITGDFFNKDWFLSVFQNKLNTWMKQQIQPLAKSLGLVDVIFYQKTYERLKEKYVQGIIQRWCEKTDPLKFTYEDLGIAAYLICLWKNQSDIYFMDVGCGNGLLVFILITEGFNGIGVDIRRRRLWDTYPEAVRQNLLELTLDPENSPGFPKVTWLIGNHSDELTPWLPVLAARSGSQCYVFALPCCPFGLFGKYNNFMHQNGVENDPGSHLMYTDPIRPLHNRSRVYIQYLCSLYTACGFIPEVDVLRIPSTKRICIIGRKRCTSAEDQSKQLGNIHEAIERERQVSAGMDRFIPRDFKIPVQNCTQIETTVKQRVSDLVFRILLTKSPELHWLKTQNLVISDSLTVQTTDGRWWNPGGQLTVQEASALLEADQLKLMKSQHGGLQTLLKNHHQAFEIRSGLIRLRFDPERMAQLNPSGGSFVSRKPAKKRLIQRKTKPCWMFSHHVDGCPYPSETCDFLHKTENISLISAE